MNERLQELLDAVQRTASQVGGSAADAAYGMGKRAGELLSVAKLNIRIMDLKGAVSTALREVGEMIYATHTGTLTESEVLLAKLQEIDGLRQQIDRVALGHRIEVELHAGVALHQPPAFDADLFAAHEIEDRIDVRMRLGRLAGESPRLDERLDRHVVTPPAQRPDAVRQAEVEGDMAIDAVRLVAVQPAQQRRRIENRHRGLGLAVQLHDGRVQLLRRDPLDVGHHVQRRTEHRAVHHRIGTRPPAAAREPRGEERREKAAKVLFQHNFHPFSRKSTIFPPIRLLFLPKREIIFHISCAIPIYFVPLQNALALSTVRGMRRRVELK